jgi:hypothetical protein
MGRSPRSWKDYLAGEHESRALEERADYNNYYSTWVQFVKDYYKWFGWREIADRKGQSQNPHALNPRMAHPRREGSKVKSRTLRTAECGTRRGEVMGRFRKTGYVGGWGGESLWGMPFDGWRQAHPPRIRKQREARAWWLAPLVLPLLSLLPAPGAGSTTVGGRAARYVCRLYRSRETERDHRYQQNCSNSLHGCSPVRRLNRRGCSEWKNHTKVE